MTYGRLLRYFLVIATVIFVGLWGCSMQWCPSVVAMTPVFRIQCAAVHGTVDSTLILLPDASGRYRIGLRSERESRATSDNGWGRWGKTRVTIYNEPGTGRLKSYDENLPEEDYDRNRQKDRYYRKTEIPPSATVAAVSHRILVPLWLPYLVIVACAFLVHWRLTRRVASRHEALVAKSGGNNPA